jgi:hypothetical protein
MLVRCEWRSECELQWIVYSRWAGCLNSSLCYILSQNTYPKYQSATYRSKLRNSSSTSTYLVCLLDFEEGSHHRCPSRGKLPQCPCCLHSITTAATFCIHPQAATSDRLRRMMQIAERQQSRFRWSSVRLVRNLCPASGWPWREVVARASAMSLHMVKETRNRSGLQRRVFWPAALL